MEDRVEAPAEHPLSVLLPTDAGWVWLDRPQMQTTWLLHVDSGVSFELTDNLLHGDHPLRLDGDAWAPLALAMVDRAMSGPAGRFHLVVYRHKDGSTTAESEAAPWHS